VVHHEGLRSTHSGTPGGWTRHGRLDAPADGSSLLRRGSGRLASQRTCCLGWREPADGFAWPEPPGRTSRVNWPSGPAGHRSTSRVDSAHGYATQPTKHRPAPGQRTSLGHRLARSPRHALCPSASTCASPRALPARLPRPPRHAPRPLASPVRLVMRFVRAPLPCASPVRFVRAPRPLASPAASPVHFVGPAQPPDSAPPLASDPSVLERLPSPSPAPEHLTPPEEKEAKPAGSPPSRTSTSPRPPPLPRPATGARPS